MSIPFLKAGVVIPGASWGTCIPFLGVLATLIPVGSHTAILPSVLDLPVFQETPENKFSLVLFLYYKINQQVVPLVFIFQHCTSQYCVTSNNVKELVYSSKQVAALFYSVMHFEINNLSFLSKCTEF